MTLPPGADPSPLPLHRGTVLRVQEQSCDVVAGGRRTSVGYLASFPSPRTERLSPGHLVALATADGGSPVVVWRWYDAVVLGEDAGSVRLWEPAHGEVLARPRRPAQGWHPGTRAYLSAGLEGAEWWVAGPAVTRPEDAEVEIHEVARFLIQHDLWPLPPA